MDLRSFRPIGAALRDGQDDEQVRRAAGGFDHNFVIDGSGRGGEQLAAQVREPTTERTLEVWTDQPGVQFYTGSLLDGTVVGKDGRAYQQFSADNELHHLSQEIAPPRSQRPPTRHLS